MKNFLALFLLVVMVVGISGCDKKDDSITENNWQTYTNEEIGFSFKYIKDWDLSNLVIEDINNSLEEEIGPGYVFSKEDFSKINNAVFYESYGFGENGTIVIKYTTYKNDKSVSLFFTEGDNEDYVVAIEEHGRSEVFNQYLNNDFFNEALENRYNDFLRMVNSFQYVEDANNDYVIVGENWNKLNFDKLGFSMSVPISEDKFDYNYTECGPEEACDEWGYAYIGTVEGKSGAHNFLGSVSENWSPSRTGQLTDFYDYKVEYNKYYLLNSEIEFNPIDKLVVEGVEVYVFDSKKDYYDGWLHGGEFSQSHAAVFKLPNSENFKAVLITFQEEDLDLDTFKQVLKTIDFK